MSRFYLIMWNCLLWRVTYRPSSVTVSSCCSQSR